MLEIYRDELPAGVRRLLESYVRCETAPGRLARVWTLLVNGFLLRGLRPNLAILWYLWDMNGGQAWGCAPELRAPPCDQLTRG